MTSQNTGIARGLKITLDIAWYLFIALLVLAFGLLAWGLASGGNVPGHLSLPVAVTIDPSLYSISAPDAGISGAELEELSGDLRFRSPDRQFVVFFAVYLALGIAIVLMVVYQLRRIIATLAGGTPFVPANAWRIHFIGWVVIAGEFVQEFIEFLGHVAVKTVFDTQGVAFHWSPDVSVTTIFWGCVLLALAEVFRLGVAMQEEQSLTV